MISEEQRKSLDPVATEVLRQFEQRFQNLDSEINSNGNLVIYFPAKSAELGEMYIVSEGYEITVYIGDDFHSHFDAYLDEVYYTPKSLEEGVSDVMDFVRGIFEDKIVVEVDYEGGEVLGYEARNIDERRSAPPAKNRSEKHLWSGRKAP